MIGLELLNFSISHSRYYDLHYNPAHKAALKVKDQSFIKEPSSLIDAMHSGNFQSSLVQASLFQLRKIESWSRLTEWFHNPLMSCDLQFDKTLV